VVAEGNRRELADYEAHRKVAAFLEQTLRRNGVPVTQSLVSDYYRRGLFGEKPAQNVLYEGWLVTEWFGSLGEAARGWDQSMGGSILTAGGSGEIVVFSTTIRVDDKATSLRREISVKDTRWSKNDPLRAEVLTPSALSQRSVEIRAGLIRLATRHNIKFPDSLG
jgi:hypothetical protein